jgi:hypothetical protein
MAPNAPSMPRCPSPELVYACQEGALPSELHARVAEHVERCRICQMLREALADVPAEGLTVIERDRIRTRVRAGIEPPARGGWWPEQRVAFGAAGVLAIIAVGSVTLWQFSRESVAPEPIKIAGAVRPARAPSVLDIEKRPIPRPADDLLWRGAQTDDRDLELQELARALEPYQRDDFAEAAGRLTALTVRRPRSAMAYLYLGISDLFLGRHQEGVAAVSTARRLATGDPELSNDVNWYLGLAYQRLGDRDAARAVFESLCQGRTVRSALGCAALLELSGPPYSPVR